MADHEKLINEYLEKYGSKGCKYIYHARAATMTDLTAEDLRTTARTTKETAAALDRWTPAEMRMLSLKAYGYLADMLNYIEHGASWPEQLTSARAVLLSKEPDDELNPLAYRALLMIPAIYRMWSETRLRHLAPWIAEWALPEMYAGVEGRGSQDAAYNTALLTEWCKAMDLGLTGGAADIYKCFDQLSRPPIYLILENRDAAESFRYISELPRRAYGV